MIIDNISDAILQLAALENSQATPAVPVMCLCAQKGGL